MREIRLYGSEGGGAAALPTPIPVERALLRTLLALICNFFTAPCQEGIQSDFLTHITPHPAVGDSSRGSAPHRWGKGPNSTLA